VSDSRRAAAGHERPRLPGAAGRSGDRTAGHSHDRIWRRADVGARHEGWRGRLSHQTLSGPGDARRGRGHEEEMLASLEPYWPEASFPVYTAIVVAAVQDKPHFATETRLSSIDGREFEVWFTACYPPEMLARGKLPIGIVDISAVKRPRRRWKTVRSAIAACSIPSGGDAAARSTRGCRRVPDPSPARSAGTPISVGPVGRSQCWGYVDLHTFARALLSMASPIRPSTPQFIPCNDQLISSRGEIFW
jgi:hypothetical protein